MEQAHFLQDVRWLLKEKYHWSFSQISDFFGQYQSQLSVISGELPEQVLPEITADIQRLKKGEPIAYVIGWVNFLGCHIDLSLRPLIPRPETEFWVEKILGDKAIQEHFAFLERKQQTPTLLDLCCGSGCIGIAAAKKFPRLKVTSADISTDALKQTALNAQLNDVSERVRVVQSDLFKNLENQRFDFLFSNPPYVDPDGEFSVDLVWEPKESLFARKGGIELIERIIFDAKKHLNARGVMVIEFGKGQEDVIAQLANEARWNMPLFTTDQFGVVRCCVFNNQ